MNYRKLQINSKINNLKKRKRLIKKPGLFFFNLIIILLISLISLAIFLPNFQIKNIEIAGNNKNKELESEIWKKLNQKIINIGPLEISLKNIFLISPASLSNHLKKKFPNIENIYLNKNFFAGNITVEIKERIPFAIFCQKQNEENLKECFWIDKNGILFEEAVIIPQNATIINMPMENKKVILNELDWEIIEKINQIQKNLYDNFQISARDFLISNFIIVTTDENWKIYFDLESDINLQIVKMNALLKEQISVKERQSLEYIYLQYKDKAYYK